MRSFILELYLGYKFGYCWSGSFSGHARDLLFSVSDLLLEIGNDPPWPLIYFSAMFSSSANVLFVGIFMYEYFETKLFLLIEFCNCKGTVILGFLLIQYHAMKTYGGVILNFGTEWRRVVSFMSLPLYFWKNRLWYQWHRWLGGTRRLSVLYEEQ
jgi:hypothetical protein